MGDGTKNEDGDPTSAKTIATEANIPRYSFMDDIKRFDQRFCEVTKGLPIRTGSISRVPSEVYHRWGIGLTPENRQALAEMSEGFRRKDYDYRKLYGPTNQYEDTPFTRTVKTNLARMIGIVVKEIMKSLDDGTRSFRICDIATGRGRALTAIATALRSDRITEGIIERTSFNLVDFNAVNLPSATANLEQFRPGEVRAHSMKDEDFLADHADQFDIIVSLCHFHKKPFPDIYGKVFSALREGGALVSGDWHSSLCNHPSSVYQLLEKMRIESRRLDMFKELMGNLVDPVTCPFMSIEQIKSIHDHQTHWADVYHAIITSPTQVTQPRIFVLGAFDTTQAREQKLRDAGFSIDNADISRAFPKAKLPVLPKWIVPGSDRASVMMGIKPHAR